MAQNLEISEIEAEFPEAEEILAGDASKLSSKQNKMLKPRSAFIIFVSELNNDENFKKERGT